MKKRLFTLFWLLCPLLFAGWVDAKDITIYVQADQKPKVWFWGDANNGSYGWPGEALSSTKDVVNPTTGATHTFYYKTFTGLAENASISMLINYNGDDDKTADITGITSDRYFWYKGNKQYEDLTEQFTVIPDATIDAVGISGGFNSWPNFSDAPKFTEVTANETYTYNLDLTNIDADVSFKIQPNGIWIGYTGITVSGGETSWLSDDGSSDHNIKLANSTSGYKTYLLTATWAGGKNAGEGWTLKVEGVDPRTEPIVNTYTVVGSPTDLFGGFWDPTLDANNMVEGEAGVFTLTKENVNLSAGDIEFKIVKNHSWGSDHEYGVGGLGGGNVVYNVAEAGLYNVTFSFNPEETTVTPQINVTAAAYDYTQHSYRVCGEGFAGGWAASEADATMNTMTLTDGKFVFTKTGYDVADAHSESYRIRVDDDYKDASPYIIAGINTNNTLEFDAAGTYDITITFDPEAIEVTAVATAAETPEPETTYTIVGVADVVNGTAEWATDATANDMTASAAGVYELVVEGASLTSGTDYEYKMVKNHDWGDGEVPAQGNQTLSVNETAVYTITYTFDGTTLSASAVKTGDIPVVDGQELVNGDHKVVIKGIHYTNLAENNYVLTITSEEEMTGLGGSFWALSTGNADLRDNIVLEDNGNKIIVTATSTTDPQLYTPLYVLMPGEVNFGAVTIEWEEKEAAVNYSVTFVNEAGWEGDIYAYAWTEAGVVLGDWPGTQMENEGNNTFSITLPSAADYIIFTNNNQQTPDLVFENGKQYTNVSTTNTVTFVNSRDWDVVYAYVYDGDGEVLGGWPGTEMTPVDTQVDGHDVYGISIPGTPAYIIFHNNDGSQTPDYEFENGKQYDFPIVPTQDYTVKFVDVAGWGQVNIHAWNNDGASTSWPGVPGELAGTINVFGVEADVYTCTVSLPSAPAFLIFNNGNGTQSEGDSFVEGATYSYDDTEMCYFLFTDDADQFKPEENIDVNAKASYARKFTPGVLSTVVLPFAIGADVAEEAGTFYRVTSIENGYIHGKSEIPAPYVPYVFMPAKEYPFTNINIGQLPKVDEGKVNIDGAVFEFVTEETDLESGGAFDFYGFRNGEFVKAAFAKANPFRAYFKAPHSGNAPETLLWFDDSTTGITMLKANIESGKAEVYDLQGRRVMNPVRGLYIVNGKKAVVK